MLIKRVDKRTLDVFWNTGWEYWARMQNGVKGYWRLTKGMPMPKEVYNDFYRQTNRKGK